VVARPAERGQAEDRERMGELEARTGGEQQVGIDPREVERDEDRHQSPPEPRP
jgi:hypothetical protein